MRQVDPASAFGAPDSGRRGSPPHPPTGDLDPGLERGGSGGAICGTEK